MKKIYIFIRYITTVVFLLLSILYLIKFTGPTILRLYVEVGVGNCQKLPLLCMTPAKEIISPKINKDYLKDLLLYEFPKISIFAPKGFVLVKENIEKVYYKKYKRKQAGNLIYLIHEEPKFFINLFPEVTKQGVNSDYELIKRMMFARLGDIKSLTDTFFVILKGISIPDLGDLNNVKMVQFMLTDKKGFVNYNLTNSGNYFDCNIIDSEGNFFKIYIKDKYARLDLDKVLAIISTVNRYK